MSESTKKEFSKLRSFLWPIHRSELKRFVPMLLAFFFISFNYNILRTAKDTLVVTAKNSGAETIPFIKVWAMLPMAIVLTILFTRLSNKFNREKVFYIMMSIFLGFFFVFTFFLYPFREFLHPHEFADRLQAALPQGFQGLIAIFRNWTFTAFYVMSELWGTTILTVLFWGFVNEVTPVSQAKRFYGLLGIGANVSGFLSGQVVLLLSSNIFNSKLPYGANAWEQSVLFLNVAILVTGMVIVGIFLWLNKNMKHKEDVNAPTEKPPEKIKMGLRKNFAYLAKSKYLICIALIVLTYNLSINLVEVVWKNELKALFPSPSDYTIYMAKVTMAMSLVATATAIFITGNVMRRTSWTLSALIPPLIMLVTGALFFSFLLFKTSSFGMLAAFFGSTPLIMGVFFGSLQNVMARASKYTLFDATKEISFIPLSRECKLKGKAAIDGVGSRIGKSGGSVIHQGLLMMFATVAGATPYVACIFFVVIGVWALAVLSLGKQFNDLTVSRQTLDIPEEEPVFVEEGAKQEALG